MKYKVIDAARTMGLLPVLDRISMTGKSLATAGRNRQFLRDNPSFRPPPRDLAFDAYNKVDWQEYDENGRRQAHRISSLIKGRLGERKAEKVLEWGCGPGRLIRHIPEAFPEADIIGTDYNPKTIAWCEENIDGVRFHLNGLMPPLPLEDDSVDATYNFSVFTHLGTEAQRAWANELFRVLKPGGVLVATTHGEAYRYLLVREEQQKAFDEGEVVLQENYDEGQKWYFSVHPSSYVTCTLLGAFAKVEKADGESFGIKQDVWVAEKPGG